MKKLLLILIIGLSFTPAQAQFTKATLQATGLTCAMCSNAINKALQKVPFVESVQSDIKNSAFNLVFRADSTVNIDALRNAVEDAGFFIGGLKLKGDLTGVNVVTDTPVKLEDGIFIFLNTESQVLSGEKTVTVVDKGFMTAKEFKKKGASVKDTNASVDGKKIYCVTI
ncbi:MAG: heavy metal-associated domain-containing protein [Chitinophagaceae bacterium]